MSNNEYSIGTVARLTGLSPQLIRAWERRYRAVVARRSANGRRVYTPRHVEQLTLLKALTDRGTAISAVAGLDLAGLRARVAEMDQIRARPLTGNVQVAVLGVFLPALLADERLACQPLELVCSGADPQRMAADLHDLRPDVLVIESTSLNPAVLTMIDELAAISGANEVLVAYGFARRADETTLLDKGIRLLKTPVSGDELALAILGSVSHGGEYKPAATTGPGQAREPVRIDRRLRIRRYSEQQLGRLSEISTDVDCECPRQLAEILKTLTAFESYSADCENRNERDAALHAFLHQATAHSRAVMEQALDHLLDVEQISL